MRIFNQALTAAEIQAVAFAHTAPTIVAGWGSATNTVKVLFSQEVSSSSAQTAGNYTIPGLTVTEAVLQGDGKTVALTLQTAMTAGASYTLHVSGVQNPGGLVVDGYVGFAGYSVAPVAHWAFNENTGTTAADSSGNGNTGTLLNGPLWHSSPLGASCLDFDAGNDSVRVADSPSLRIAGPMTLSAWVYYNGPDKHSLGRVVWNVNAGYSLNAEDFANQTCYWSFYLGGVDNKDGRCNVPGIDNMTNQWVHLAGVYDNSGTPTTRLYINGVLAMENTNAPVALKATSGAMTIGNQDLWNTWNGRIDEVSIYNRALDAGEIAALALVSNPPKEAITLNPSLPQDVSDTPCSVASHTFSVQITGGTYPVAYQWYNATTGQPISGATGPTYTVSPPLTTSAYYCVVTNGVVPVSSRTALLTMTTPTAPTITSVMPLGNPLALRVVFSETVNSAAQTIANYTLTNAAGAALTIVSATLQADGLTVVLGLDASTPMVDGAYGLRVSNVGDTCTPPHNIIANSLARFPYSSLIGYWTLDEGSGTITADRSIYGANGTFAGETAWSSSLWGSCGDFDGAGKVVVGNPVHLQQTNSITMSAWVYWRPQPVGINGIRPAIISKAVVSNYEGMGPTLWVDDKYSQPYLDSWKFAITGDGTNRTVVSVNATHGQANSWVHVAGVYDTGDGISTLPSLRIYINGLLGAEQLNGVPVGQVDQPADVVIGNMGEIKAWTGLIDEVRIYNRALSGSEIAILAASAMKITSATASGSDLILAGTGGPVGGGYSYNVVSSTDLALPTSTWPVVGTGSFELDGTFSTSVSRTPGETKRFYVIRMP